MFFLPDTQRNQRTVAGYFNALMARASVRCIALGIFDTDAQFVEKCLNPIRDMVADGLTGDEIVTQAMDGKYLAIMKNEPRMLWVVACCAYGIEALLADKRHAANVAFSFLMDAAVCRDGIVEAQRELAIAQRAASDSASDRGREGQRARNKKNAYYAAKQTAMDKIRAEFECWQSGKVTYANDADFATKMHAKHAPVIRNEGSIKNACNRWRNVHKSSC